MKEDVGANALCEYEWQAIGGDICRTAHKFMNHRQGHRQGYRRAAYWECEFGFLRRACCCWHISRKKHLQPFEGWSIHLSIVGCKSFRKTNSQETKSKLEERTQGLKNGIPRGI